MTLITMLINALIKESLKKLKFTETAFEVCFMLFCFSCGLNLYLDTYVVTVDSENIEHWTHRVALEPLPPLASLAPEPSLAVLAVSAWLAWSARLTWLPRHPGVT